MKVNTLSRNGIVARSQHGQKSSKYWVTMSASIQQNNHFLVWIIMNIHRFGQFPIWIIVMTVEEGTLTALKY